MSCSRVLVIGLDGATWDILDPLAAAGRLPVFSRLMEKGSLGRLQSTLPCVTPPAWGSFLTGASPIRHGILDFIERTDTDRPSFVTLENSTVPRLWDILSHFGKRSVFLNVPFTFPPGRSNGVIIPGPPVPREELITWPPEMAPALKEMMPDYTADLNYSEKGTILKEIHRVTRVCRQAALWLMESEAWDFFMVTFIGPDRLHHKMWHHEEAIGEYYEALDAALGEIVGRVGSDDCVLLMSDHGFTTVKTKFYVNEWLAANGYLKTRLLRCPDNGTERFLRPRFVPERRRGKALGFTRIVRKIPGFSRASLFIDLERTKAFSSLGNIPGLFVNLKGRYESGIVEPGDAYERLRDELIRSLSAVKGPDGNGALFKRVDRREAFFSGPHADRLPDVIAEPASYSTNFRKDLGGRRLFRPISKVKGDHAPDGIFLVRGKGIRPGGRINGTRIEDVAPLILRLLGLPRISSMDGRIPLDVFEQPASEETGIFPVEKLDFSSSSHAFGEDESREIRKSLEALGYI